MRALQRTLLGGFLLAALSGGQAEARPSFDRSSVVFNTSIGEIELGMTRDQVEYLYGDTNDGRLELLDTYFPKGTKYAGKTLYRMTYRLHGGTLRVSYVDGRVKVISTTSSYYRTRSGVRVGKRIPLGACHRNRYGSCDYRWTDFWFEPDCGKAWLGGTRRVSTILYTRHARVTAIEIGDPDVIHYCF
jgi:hypothetical protein